MMARLRFFVSLVQHIAVLLSLALLVGCENISKDYKQMLSVESTTEVASGWQYRWGDSPKANGQFTWVTPSEEANAEWKDFNVPASSPPGRPSGAENVWVRTTIPDMHGRADYLYVLGFDQAAEVYLDGKRIYYFGEFNEQGKAKFGGYVWHLIPLSANDSGKKIYFRIWSAHVNIGIIGKVSIGPKSAFVRSMYDESITNIVVMMLLLFMGLLSLGIYLSKRSQSEYFYFFIQSLVGVWLFSRSSIKYFFYSSPQFWLTTEIVTVACAGAGLLGYTGAVFAIGWKNYFRRFAQTGLLFAGIVIVVGVTNFPIIMQTLLPIQIYLLVGVVSIFVQVGFALARGMLEAKVIVVGLSLQVLTSCIEILIALGLLFPSLMGRSQLMPWGILAFVMSLATVLVLRFAAVYRRVGRLKGQLEDILVGTKHMAVAREKVEAAEHAVRHIVNEISFHPGFGADVFLRHEKNERISYLAARIAEENQVMKSSELRKLGADEISKVEGLLGAPSVSVTPDEKLLVPIYWGSQKTGLIAFDKLDSKKFGEEESNFVSTLVSSLALSLSNIDFLAETKEKVALDAELAAASAVQEALLPSSTTFPGLNIVSHYTPVGQTGGDWIGYYYDRANHRLDFFVADVTGHGFPAALLTGVACGGVYTSEDLLTAIAERNDEKQTAAERLTYIAHVVNGIVVQTGQEKLMMTMALMSLDLLTGELTFVNAGHNSPYVVSRGEKKAKAIPGSGSRLGFSRTPRFAAVKRQLQPGDSFFMFTDGLIENTGPDGTSLFHERDLRKQLLADGDAPEVHAGIMAAAKAIWQGHPPVDDVTALLIQWMGPIPREAIQNQELVVPGGRKLSIAFEKHSDHHEHAEGTPAEVQVAVPVSETTNA